MIDVTNAVYKDAIDRTFGKYLSMEGVENVNVNRPYEVFCEFGGGVRERFEDKSLSLAALQTFAELVATANGQFYDPEIATLSAKLPDGTRVEIFQSNAVGSGFSAALRKRYPGRFQLKDYGFKDKEIEWLIDSVINRKTMLVSGGTSTGKTTVLEILCGYIPKQRRLITIQDPKEIDFGIPNILDIALTETDFEKRKKQLQAIAATAMRQNPDSVIIGEIRERVMASAFRQLSNTGHPGSMASIHANDPQSAIARMANLIQEQTGGVRDVIVYELKDAIDYIIQIEKNKDGTRSAYIEEISNP